MELPLRHSVQNIFFQVGQFDRYAIFDFYFGSDAYHKYGGTVYGHLQYSPSERARLQKEITSDNIGNEDGLILLDGALRDPLKNKLLKSEGFYARDVARLSAMDHGEISNQYENQSLKEIPNSINIPFHSNPFKAQHLELLIFRKRIEAEIRCFLLRAGDIMHCVFCWSLELFQKKRSVPT